MNREQPESLTVKEAIEQGYKFYVGQDFESQWPLDSVKDQEDFHSFEWYLMDKEPTFLNVDTFDIYGDLTENFAINNEVADDDDSFADLIVGAVDWQEIADKINALLATRPVYFPTKIKLIPNGK